MSLGIVFKGPEGIVLAADSRVTLTGQIPGQNLLIPATYDNATKLLKVKGQDYVGAVTYGLGAIGQQEPRTAHSFLTEFEAKLTEEKTEKRLGVEEFAKKLGSFFMDRWKSSMPSDYKGPPMLFLIGGYDENTAYGRVFEVSIPSTSAPKEWHAAEFGAVWGGQTELIDRLIKGYDRRIDEIVGNQCGLSPEQQAKLTEKLGELNLAIPYQFLPLQDSVDLSIFLIRATITLQTWQLGVRGVGGAIDVATITQTEGFKSVQQKKIRGE